MRSEDRTGSAGVPSRAVAISHARSAASGMRTMPGTMDAGSRPDLTISLALVSPMR